MRKILFSILLACVLALSITPGTTQVSQAATTQAPILVQISDLQFPEFYHSMLVMNQAKDLRLNIEKIVDYSIPGQYYDSYLVSATRSTNPKDHAAVITIFTNKAGYVSKLTITAVMDNPEAKLDAYRAERLILRTLGVGVTQSKAFQQDILARDIPFQTAYWLDNSKRNLIVSHAPSPSLDSLLYIRMTAVDKKLSPERR
ncbi:hypothetical protein [uncultured Megasphaera sp.]|jgi:hypothetical protein|uniref:hypothetical protein n=1 Tax=uncultured Megasphaera sp. TaxID=165188 RepID=UPI0025839AB3|nr:hypothetical protein [uncultured Megasphaera sp.]